MSEQMTAAEFRAEHKGHDSERELQAAVCEWMDVQGVTYFAIPNGQYRPGQRPEVGMQAGVPDLCIPQPSSIWGDGADKARYPEMAGALYIELKTKTGRLRDEQIEWLDRLTDAGNACTVCRSIDDVIDTVREYMGGTIDDDVLWPHQR